MDIDIDKYVENIIKSTKINCSKSKIREDIINIILPQAINSTDFRKSVGDLIILHLEKEIEKICTNSTTISK